MALLVAPLLGTAASAQDTPVTTTAVPATTTTVPAPSTVTAGPGVYGAPRWLPLRRDLPGTEVKVGCTYDSHGSQHGYECSGHHSRWAIDFIADSGTPIYAAGAGFATLITGKPGGGGFGNVVRIDHGFGISTVYAHMTEAMVPPEGAWVDPTTQIGTVGQTGSASAPHLHFEEFAGTDPGSQVSIDPGALFACRGDFLVSYPQVSGFDSWQGLPWGSLTVASDGDGCVADDLTAAEPAVPVPSSGEAADQAEGDGGVWADLIASMVEAMVVSPGDLTGAR